MGAIATIVVAIGWVLFLGGGAALVFLALRAEDWDTSFGERSRQPLLTLHTNVIRVGRASPTRTTELCLPDHGEPSTR